VAVTAVLSAVDANRRAQSMSIVIGNLNLATESMVRDIRTGRSYTACGSVNDCVNFIDKENREIEYRFESDQQGSYITKEYINDSLESSGRITSEDVDLTEVSFIIDGDGVNDGPERLLFHLKGDAGSGKSVSEFNIQTLITSRVIDIAEFD